MALPQLKQPGYTLEDWKTWEGRWELINGVAYDMTPSPSLQHYQVSHGLERATDAAWDEVKRKSGGGACERFHAPVDLHLDTGVFIPDLMVVCDPVKQTPRGIEGAPDLVVEILSPGTAQKDWTHKRTEIAEGSQPRERRAMACWRSSRVPPRPSLASIRAK